MLPDLSQEKLRGRHVVVTGGTGGLGRDVVARMLQLGAIVHAPVWLAEELEGVNWLEVNTTTGVDLRDEAQVRAYYQALPELWASVHLVGGFSMGPINQTSVSELRRLMELNATTAYLCCQAAVEKMRSSTQTPGGRIVNVSARPVELPTAEMVAYSMSKAAVSALTRALAVELAPEEIWVNAIAPGIIDTLANRKAMPKADHSKWVPPKGIGRVVSNLVMPQNVCQTGSVIPVYGQS
jgi:NAD(P)-dependent dehydrogenase (short-subunit alcohol dehydrogenase family)